MSVKHNLFINRIAALTVLLCLPVCVSAQKYDRLLKRNLWNDGSNMAALRLDSLDFSEASLSFAYTGGDFRNYNQSSSDLSGGALARSVNHLDKFSMTGAFGFSDTEARGMCGSMFIDPGYFPIDVSEFTPGRKSFQKYLVSGGISVPLSSGWMIGASLDFKSANAAKRKDLRYTGYKLDMEFSPSVVYAIEGFAAGLSLKVGRNTEIINAEQIGTSDTAPMAFLDEGLWLGNYQTWTGSGVHLKEPGVNGLPVYKNTLGAAVQFAAGGLFAEFGFDYFRAEVGERQNVWYRFRGPECSMKLDYRFGKNTLRGYVLYEYGTNRKSVLDKVTSGGVTLVKEYGSNKIRETGILNVGVSYEWTNDAMVFGAGVSFLDRRDVVSVRYPFVSGRELMSGDVRAYATLPFGKWEIGGEIGFMAGRSNDSEWTVSEVDSDVEAPFRHGELYSVAREYETIPRIDAGLGVTRYFRKGLFAAVRGSMIKAFSPEEIPGSWRYCAGIEFGLTF